MASTMVAPDAFYATGNPLIATQAAPEQAELLVVEKQHSKTMEANKNPFNVQPV